MTKRTKVTISLLTLLIAACGDDGAQSTPEQSPTIVTSPPPLHGTPVTPDCLRDSWVAGTTEVCNGILTYHDYIYDDYGADNGAVSPAPTLLNLLGRGGELELPFSSTPGLLAPAAGDQHYPQGLENTADLVRLSLRVQGNRLHISAELNTMFDTNDALLGVAFDTDANPNTGGGHWGTLNVRSDGWEHLYIASQGDPDTNLLGMSIPLPAGDHWRIQAAVAQADGRVMNVAFRGHNEEASATTALPAHVIPGNGNFWEDRQAAALAFGDISEFSQVVDVQALKTQAIIPAPKPTGFQQRVYTSAYTLGEGIASPGILGRDGGGVFCGQSFNYLGKYQPYGVYIPTSVSQPVSPSAMMVVLHGCNANHASQINQPNMQRQFGDELDRILVTPLGRGPFGFYTGISERDVLDVMADMHENYQLDQDQVFVSGYSMGGFGALHMATHYPDRFAGVINWVGHTGDLLNKPSVQPLIDNLLDGLIEPLLRPVMESIVGSIANPQTGTENVIDYLQNLRHVPSAHVYAAGDELVPIHEALAIAQRLALAEEVDYHFYLHPLAEHLTFVMLDQWAKEASLSATWKRVTAPSRVSYVFDPRFDYPEVDIAHNQAYWLSNLVARHASEAYIDLSARGCDAIEKSFSNGNDQGLDPIPWLGSYRHEASQAYQPPETTLRGELKNVLSATLDIGSVCLENTPIWFAIDSDGPAQIRLTDGRVLNLNAGVNQGVF